MTEHNESDELSQLILRGESLLQRIQGVEDKAFFASIGGYLGRMFVAHVETPKWKDTASEVVDAGVEALSGSSKKLHEDYVDWYTDCKILFSKKGWNRSRRVKIFDEIPSLVNLDSIGIRVRMIVEKQIQILKDLVDVSPRSWSLARAGVLVFYCAICIFVDTYLSILFGLAVVPVAAFQVGLILAFPTLEKWITG